MHQRYQALLRSFATRVGIDPDALVATEELAMSGLAVGLAFEGNEDMGDLLYFCALGIPAPEDQANLHRTLLEANHFWNGSGGTTLSLHPETGHVICCARADLAHLDADGLTLLLDAFFEIADFWRRVVTGTATADPDAPVQALRV